MKKSPVSANPEPLALRAVAVARRLVRLAVPGQSATPTKAPSALSTRGLCADVATCDDCLGDISDPSSRRYRYAFASCGHCGPGMSLANAAARRANYEDAPRAMCDACHSEFDDPLDRHYRSPLNHCPDCGPRVWLEDRDGVECSVRGLDAIEDAAGRLRAGDIIAIKGLSGFHLACLAHNADAVTRLRRRKYRHEKPFALMARDVGVIGRHADMDDSAEALLRDPRAPIVVMPAHGKRLPSGIAPGLDTVGFMLPHTPLQHLLLESFDEPLVMTSGNQSDEPQVTDNAEARFRLSGIADGYLMHDREIANRLDDSIVVAQGGQVVRRARGFAPDPIQLHASFAASQPVLGMGGDIKNTFCLLGDGEAVVSQHNGDTERTAELSSFRNTLDLYLDLFRFQPATVAVDLQPDYLPSKVGRELAKGAALELVQHHHAHVAACLAEHGCPVDQSPVLGIVLDGMGLGDDGATWGGEILLADFKNSRRVAGFQPVPLPGGALAAREPWRNTWAHLDTAFGWPLVRRRHDSLELIQRLAQKPVSAFGASQRMPVASSAGRLFDAVAAACGLCFDEVAHEAQAAAKLETLAKRALDVGAVQPYPVTVTAGEQLLFTWQSLWRYLLDDLACDVPVPHIAARFHLGVAVAIAGTALRLCDRLNVDTLVLSGGVFQNHVLQNLLIERLESAGRRVLVPRRLPPNDGGLSLGQAAVAAARQQGG
ncbi:MAG: carbamoyltransferase HypF [Pseudomonadota bacterium]